VGISRDSPNFLGTPIISGTTKATDFKFSQYIQRVHPNKSPWKIWGKKGAWACPGTAQFTPYYLRNGESYGFQILHAHLWAQSEQKPVKNSGDVAVGVVRDSWVMKIFRAPMHKAHRAVIFAIAQLSCIILYDLNWGWMMRIIYGNTYVYSSQRQTINYKCKDRDRQNKNQIKKACHTT